MALNHATQSGKHPSSVRGHDLYETPPEAVHALLEAEKLPRRIWEPAAGRGAIVNILRDYDRIVFASDLVDYGVYEQQPGMDFYMVEKPPPLVTCIVTNPPYRQGNQFVRHALKLCPKVYMLLRLSFLESKGREDILDCGWLRRVHVFKNRLPMMHRDGWDGPKASSAIPFAWFVWDRGPMPGRTVLDRISWS